MIERQTNGERNALSYCPIAISGLQMPSPKFSPPLPDQRVSQLAAAVLAADGSLLRVDGLSVADRPEANLRDAVFRTGEAAKALTPSASRTTPPESPVHFTSLGS